MLRLSKKTLYAIEAVLDVAYHMGAQPVQSRDITRRQGIPRRYLEQALQQLVKADILVGVRGPKGGYRLARERRRITVGEIVRVIAGADGAEDLLEDTEGSDLGIKVVRPLWAELREAAMARLDDTTIDELCLKANRAGVESEGRPNLDFII
ncbi:MAG: transcriptional regulator [Rhodospirillales bacterium CG15_BIG_FIL_POST_REV_8_21_14_020_66_15]|nr:MAG: transcriptional regulator [Rhodospirillales bacterium CG15_BIG_FIL_POST_REV_8_21_14_020_66_15]